MSLIIEKTYHYGAFNGYRFDFRRNTKKAITPPLCVVVGETDVLQLPSKCCDSDCTNNGRFAHCLKTNGWFCSDHIEPPNRNYEFSPPEQHTNKNECPICYEDIRSVSESMTTTCGHIFHRRCMSRWLASRHSCPMCRETLFDYDTYVFTSEEGHRTKLLCFNRAVLSGIMKKGMFALSDMSWTTNDITRIERIIRALKKLDPEVLTEMYENVTI
jgi:hypothetical protein